MKYVRRASLDRVFENGAEFILDEKHLLSVQVLENKIMRLLLRKHGRLALGRTWSLCPGADELDFDGRPRASVEGFGTPEFQWNETENGWRIATERIVLCVDREPFNLRLLDRNESPLLTGTPTGFLSLGRRDERHWNLWEREAGDRFYGLGEKSGGLDHAGRRLEMRCLDAMGYDAETSDPLYKHYPFLILKRPTHALGLFYDNLAPVVFDTGREMDNYHGEFFSYRAPSGDMDLYLIHGPRIKQVTETFSWMTGRTYFGPRWSLGYSGSTMAYTEADNAQELLEGFVADCRHHDIPCHSFQLSSGYTSIHDKRYVFHWNRDRVPDPHRMARVFHEAGIKLAANVKPVLLHDHPRFQEARAAGLFIGDSERPDEPEVSRFWDAEASHLDFTNPDTREWWRGNIDRQLFDYGVDCLWNDNNEFEIWDDEAVCRHPDGPLPIKNLRPVQTLLMMQTSFAAHRHRFPDRRAWAISRSGCPGMQRYVQTWSGDNLTDWKSLKYNIRMGLSLSLSGMYNVGHDVGGFAGPKPDPELFTRWVQNGIFHPRFTIHSWNSDGSVTEPWMYPDTLPLIRDAVRLRLGLAPYLYHLLHRAHAYYEPMLRPTFYDHEDDPSCFAETDDFLLGPSLLVASVVEPGVAVREVYLPGCPEGWVDFWSGAFYEGGRMIRVPVDLTSIPLFVKAGHALPMTAPEHRAFTDGGTERTLKIFPGPARTSFESYLYEDDGTNLAYRRGDSTRLKYRIDCAPDAVRVRIENEGSYRPPFEQLRFAVAGHPPVLKLFVNDVESDVWSL